MKIGRSIKKGENMKLAKLSLAAIAVVGLSTSSFGSDTLADAFKEGKISGELKAFYWDRDRNPALSGDSIFNTGLMLNYKTGSLNGFSMNITGQTNHAPFASKTAKTQFGWDEYGSGAQLSEAYLAYGTGKTTVQVGRMFLNTPLIASLGNRVVKEAFEGVSVVNTDIPNTTLTAAYVQKFQAQTDGTGNIGQFTNYSNPYGVSPLLVDGAYTIVAVNKSIAGLTLTAAYAEDVETKDQMGYAEAAYEGKENSFIYGLAAQYYFNDKDITGTKSSDLIGVKASVGVGALSGYVAYSTVSKDAAVTPGIGWGADLAYTGTVILSSSYGANTDAYVIGLGYAINSATTIGTAYTVTDDEGLGWAKGKVTYISLTGNYAFDGALKGLGIGLMYDKENMDKAGAKDKDEFRFSAIYKF